MSELERLIEQREKRTAEKAAALEALFAATDCDMWERGRLYDKVRGAMDREEEASRAVSAHYDKRHADFVADQERRATERTRKALEQIEVGDGHRAASAADAYRDLGL